MSLKQKIDDLRKYRVMIFTIFVFCMVSTLSFLATQNMDHSSAANTSGFKAGNIISDAVMGNYNAMSVSDIQNFLTSKNSCKNTSRDQYNSLKAQYPHLDWHFENGHFVCLSEEKFGDGTVIGKGQTAAEIIYQAAQDYHINPQVLLVLLEKEQSLISDTFPNSLQYRSATGYGCPDTAACDTKYYGFKNQVRNAAELFRHVLDHGYSAYPEKTKGVYIGYNPNSACGRSEVYIENRATAALYRYTPYQPNAAALAAGYGTGDGCSAYGNRNFYLLFTDWFGSTQAEIPTAKYQVLPEGEFVIASALSYDTVLAATGNTNGANVTLQTRNAAQSGRWKVQYNSNDYTYTFVNVVSGKTLDLQSQVTNDGGNIHLYDQNGTCAQRWHVVANIDGSKSLLSACSKTAALTADSSTKNIQVNYYNAELTKQKWYFMQDATIENGLYEIVAGTNDKLRLDVANGISRLGNGTNVQVYESNNTAAQKWQITYNSKDGTYMIANPNRELVLDVKSGGTVNGSNIQMYAQNNTAAQKWYILPQNDGYTIVSTKSGRVADIVGNSNKSGANVQIHDSSKTKAQTWYFKQTISSQQVANGIYEIIAGTNSHKAIDVSGGVANARNGTNVQIFERNQTDAQKWRITYDKANDVYSIINVTSNLSLDVTSGSLANGANIQVYTQNNTQAQRWTIIKNNDNSFTITSSKSGLSLDITSGGTYNGANVQQYIINNTPAQKWQLVKIGG